MTDVSVKVKEYEDSFDRFLDELIDRLEITRNEMVTQMKDRSLLYTMVMVLMMHFDVTDVTIDDFEAKIKAIEYLPVGITMTPIEDGKGRIWVHPIPEKHDDENSDNNTLP